MAVARALCPVIIGRETQQGELDDALLEALRGEGGVLLVSGEAGMGKTRLVSELAATARRLGCPVLIGGCSEADLALPYLPFLEAVGNHLSSTDLAGLRARLGTAADELAQLFPQLGASAPPGGDAMQSKLRLFEALLAVLRDTAQTSGLLLVVEDLHWADPATRELLDYLSRRLRDQRVLLAATFRSDELHRKHPLLPTLQGWRRAGLVREVELTSLDSAGVAGMVRAIFDEREVSSDFSDFLLRRTEGNPFVLEEMLKAAIDRGDIYRTEGGWDRKSVAELKLPDTVRDTILLRFERLGEGERDVLSAAAVVGQVADVPTLVAVTGLSEDDVVAALRACVLQQLLLEEGSSEGAYRFRHALTREAIYEDLLQPQRKRLHARVAETLQSRPNARSVDVANHLLLAGEIERGARACIGAAEEAMHAVAYSDAADLYLRAAEHATGAERGTLLCQVGFARWNNSESLLASRAFTEGVELLEAAGRGPEAARWRIELGRCLWELRHSDRARQEFERAREVLEPLGPSGPLALAYIRLSGLHVFEFESERGLELAERAVEIARQSGAALEEAWAWNFVAVAERHLGRLSDCWEHMERSYQQSAAGGFRFQMLNAVYNALQIAAEMADGQAATRWLQRMPPTNRDYSDRYLPGRHALYRGEVPAGLEDARVSVERAEASGNQMGLWRSRVLLAEVLAEADRGAEAADVLPPVSSRADLQDASYDGAARVRAARSRNDHAGMLEAARSVPAGANSASHSLPAVVEALASEPAELAAYLAEVPVRGELAGSPHWIGAQGALALAEGRAQDAANLLGDAVRRLEQEGFRLDAWHAERELAEAEAALGLTGAAGERLERIAQDAHSAGALLAARLARETAETLGLQIAPSPAPVSEEPELVDVGERLVSVLFVDVRGYTSLTSRTAPADLAEKIGSLQRWAAQEVRDHRGVVDKFAGDAVMATFNASGASIDHAEHALAAALAIRDKASLLGLPVGAGIAVGPAVVGRLAGGANLSVLGDVTNLAARLQAGAGPGEIRLSQEAHRRVEMRLAERGVRAERLELELKGIDHPVIAYALAAAPVEVA